MKIHYNYIEDYYSYLFGYYHNGIWYSISNNGNISIKEYSYSWAETIPNTFMFISLKQAKFIAKLKGLEIQWPM